MACKISSFIQYIANDDAKPCQDIYAQSSPVVVKCGRYIGFVLFLFGPITPE